MTSKCHNCGREYLTARAMAGKAIACRSCGALNDGGGGSPPVPPSRSSAPSAGPAVTKPISGPAFSIGDKPRAVDSRAVDAAYRAAVEAKAAAESGSRRESDGGSARMVRAIGIAVFALALVIVGGLFLVRYLNAKPVATNWARYQLAVPQVRSAFGTGTGFVIEDKRQLWLLTNFHVIEGAREVDVLFRSPADGSVLFRASGVPTREFRVHPRFLEVVEGAADQRTFDIAAVSLESYRANLEQLGVKPLEIAPLADITAGARVVAIGHVGTSAFDLAAEGDDAAAGVATHSLFDGVVSNVRRTVGKPTLVQTSANFSNGCSGGPLMLEGPMKVAGINTWGALNSDGSEKAGLKFALAAEQAFDIIRLGTPLQSLRRDIELAATTALPPAGVVDEATKWSTFPSFQGMLDFLVQNGWRMTGRGIAVTGRRGDGVYRHRVVGLGGVEVGVLVLPRDRSIDLNILEITGEQFRGLGQDLNPSHGTAAVIRVNMPGTHTPAVIQQGVELSIAVETLFMDEPISARYLIMVFERPAIAAVDPSTSSPPTAASEGSARPSADTGGTPLGGLSGPLPTPDLPRRPESPAEPKPEPSAEPSPQPGTTPGEPPSTQPTRPRSRP